MAASPTYDIATSGSALDTRSPTYANHGTASNSLSNQYEQTSLQAVGRPTSKLTTTSFRLTSSPTYGGATNTTNNSSTLNNMVYDPTEPAANNRHYSTHSATSNSAWGIGSNLYDETEVDAVGYSQLPQYEIPFAPVPPHSPQSEQAHGDVDARPRSDTVFWDPNVYKINNANTNRLQQGPAYAANADTSMSNGNGNKNNAPSHHISPSQSRTIRTLVAVCIISLLVACAAIAIAVIALSKAKDGIDGSASASTSAASTAASTAAQNDATRADVLSINISVTNLTASIQSTVTAMRAVDTTLTAATSNMQATISTQSATLSTQSATLSTQSATLSAVVAQNALLVSMIRAMNQTQQQLALDLASLYLFRFNPLSCTGSSTGWTGETVSVGTLCRRTVQSTGGCGSIFLNPGRTYSSVDGWVTLYQYGSSDAFGSAGYPTYGDSLTIWSGSTFLWDFVAGHSFDASSTYRELNCPANGGPNPPSTIGRYWSCASGASTAPLPPYGIFYPTPLFGPTMPFSRTITPTSSPLELRICLDEGHANEDIYVGNFSLTVS